MNMKTDSKLNFNRLPKSLRRLVVTVKRIELVAAIANAEPYRLKTLRPILTRLIKDKEPLKDLWAGKRWVFWQIVQGLQLMYLYEPVVLSKESLKILLEKGTRYQILCYLSLVLRQQPKHKHYKNMAKMRYQNIKDAFGAYEQQISRSVVWLKHQGIVTQPGFAYFLVLNPLTPRTTLALPKKSRYQAPKTSSQLLCTLKEASPDVPSHTPLAS